MNPRVILFSGAHGEGFGAERVLDHLIASSVARIAAVIAPPGSSALATAESQGLPALAWSTTKNSSLQNLLAFTRFDLDRARACTPNLFHAWHTRGFEWGLALGGRLGLPVVGTLHDDPTSVRNSGLRKYLMRNSANRLAALAVVSSALTRICRELHWTVPMETIPNGLPDEPAPPAATGGPLRIGFLGSNERWKGIDNVVRLIEALQDAPVEWKLFGSPSAEIRPLIDRFVERFPAKVRFYGRRSPREIYAEVDVIFHPSLAFDPYPTVLLEAARAGTPVVASRIGGAPEIVRDGDTGFLFPPDDVTAAQAIFERLLSDESSRLRMAENARKRYEDDFRVAKMAEGYRQFWERILAKPSS